MAAWKRSTATYHFDLVAYAAAKLDQFTRTKRVKLGLLRNPFIQE